MKKIVNFRPFVLFAFALIAGIALSFLSIYGMSLITTIIIIFIGILVFIAHFAFKKTRMTIISIVAFMFVLIGLFCGTLRIDSNLRYQKIGEISNCSVRGKIVEVQHDFDKQVSYYTIEKPTLNGEKAHTDMLLSTALSDYEIGDYVAFTADVKPYDKDSLSFILSSGIGLSGYSVSEIEIVDSQKTFFETMHLQLKKISFEYLGEQGAVCYALLTGNVNYIDAADYDNVKFSGACHIFAVSGLHITFIVFVLSYLFKLLSIKRCHNATLVSLIAFIYVGVCGFTPSAMRAAIMSTIVLFATALGKKKDYLNIIMLSLIIVLLINPMDLLSVGFQLSYACIIAIELFVPTFRRALKFMPKVLCNSVSTGLAVFFGTTPILCFYFGYFSVATILLNLILVPFISIFFGLLWIATMIVSVFPSLSDLMVAIEGVSRLFSDIMSAISFRKFALSVKVGPIMLAIYYAIAIFASDKINSSKTVKMISAVVPFPMLLLIGM